MRKILIVLAVFASITAASAQTQPTQEKTKECCKAKKDCSKEEETKGSHCSPDSKSKVLSTVKKSPAKKS